MIQLSKKLFMLEEASDQKKDNSDLLKALAAAGITAGAGAAIGHEIGSDYDVMNDSIADKEIEALNQYAKDFNILKLSKIQDAIDAAQSPYEQSAIVLKDFFGIKDDPSNFIDSNGKLTEDGQENLAKKLMDEKNIPYKTALKLVKDTIDNPENFQKYLTGEDYYNLKAISEKNNPMFRHIKQTGINFLDNMAFHNKINADDLYTFNSKDQFNDYVQNKLTAQGYEGTIRDAEQFDVKNLKNAVANSDFTGTLTGAGAVAGGAVGLGGAALANIMANRSKNKEIKSIQEELEKEKMDKIKDDLVRKLKRERGLDDSSDSSQSEENSNSNQQSIPVLQQPQQGLAQIDPNLLAYQQQYANWYNQYLQHYNNYYNNYGR
jgi:hypothetical protein